MREGATYPSPGAIVAEKYRIVRLLGEGGMGAVFAAEHVLLRQFVALKIRRPTANGEDPGVARFLNEARAAARLENEHIARVMDVGVLPSGLAFIVMELLEGLDLAALLAERGPLPAAEAVGYVLQAIEGIADAHAHGIVHRDLKPANLFRVQTGRQKGLVKVLDFGVSKLSDTLGGSVDNVTTGATLLGTPSYMSPEQIRAPKTVDARADVWALGVILYELIAGVRPFEAETLGELLTAVVEQSPLTFRELGIALDPALEAAIRRCLEVAPELRFPDVASLAEALVVGREDGASVLASVRKAQRGSEREAPALSLHGGQSSVPDEAPRAVTPAKHRPNETLQDDRAPPTGGEWEGAITPPKGSPGSPVVRRVAAVLAVAAVAITVSAFLAVRHNRANAPDETASLAPPTGARSEPPVATAPERVVEPAAVPSDAPPVASASSAVVVRAASSPKIDARHRPHPLDAGAPSPGAFAAGDPGALDLLNRH